MMILTRRYGSERIGRLRNGEMWQWAVRNEANIEKRPNGEGVRVNAFRGGGVVNAAAAWRRRREYREIRDDRGDSGIGATSSRPFFWRQW